MPDRDSPLRLTDDQMRQYIVNGYLVFKPDLPDGLHENIRQKIAYVLDNEYNPGNNILPRVPDMHHVLDSPEVRGALISVLGDAKEKGNALAGLNSAAGFLHRSLRQHLSLRHIPNLFFSLDESIEHGQELLDILDSLSNQGKLPARTPR